MDAKVGIVRIQVVLVFLLIGKALAVPIEKISHFNSDEHDLIGNVTLPENIGPQLTLSNGAQVPFSAIVALAGDFYGVPESPIIDPEAVGPNVDQENRRQRFMASYGTLVEGEADKLVKLVNMIKEDQAAKASGGKLHTDAEWDEATGGKWTTGVPLSHGTMLKLAKKNSDHFQPQAKQAYLVGHALAIEKAREAAKEPADSKDQKRKLMEAYSMEAFACHYLTDGFSAGHLRTPRVELHKEVSPELLGDGLSKIMHDEDCKYGLRVKNMNGDKWIAYGDGHLHKSGSEQNFKFVKEAVQKSIQQLNATFHHPSKEVNPDEVTDILPFVDPEAANNSPLFQMKNGKLHQRASMSDLQDTKTVKNWWGSSVQAALSTLFRTSRKNSALPEA